MTSGCVRWKLCAPSALWTVPGHTMVQVGIVEAWSAANVTPRCRSRKVLGPLRAAEALVDAGITRSDERRRAASQEHGRRRRR